MHSIITAATNEDFQAAVSLFKEYALWLSIDLSFQNFDEELLGVKEIYAAPAGAVLLCKCDGAFVACVAIRSNGENIAELKRMYVKPAYQRKGIAAALLTEALQLATTLGYKKVRLDTLANMLPAINLYKKAGFYEIPAYYFNPEQNAVFFERLL